ncbi:MAG: hypothetical protein ACE5FY_05845 [Nitrospiria bacterium]
MVFPLIIGIISGAIVGVIAEQKNRPFFPWAIYGFWFFFVAIIHVAVIGDKSYEDAQLKGVGYVKCPACAEMVRQDASLCKHCKTPLAGKESNIERTRQEQSTGKTQFCRWCKQTFEGELGNKCPSCGGSQLHFLRDNPLLIALILCLLMAMFAMLAQTGGDAILSPESTTEDTSEF